MSLEDIIRNIQDAHPEMSDEEICDIVDALINSNSTDYDR